MQKLRLRLHQPGLSCAAKHLLKIKILPLISHINNPVGMIILHSLDDGCKVSGVIKSCPVRLQYHTGRNLLCVGVLLYIHHQSALADIGIALLFHIINHTRNHIMNIRFPFPEVELHIQLFIIFL